MGTITQDFSTVEDVQFYETTPRRRQDNNATVSGNTISMTIAQYSDGSQWVTGHGFSVGDEVIIDSSTWGAWAYMTPTVLNAICTVATVPSATTLTLTLPWSVSAADVAGIGTGAMLRIKEAPSFPNEIYLDQTAEQGGINQLIWRRPVTFNFTPNPLTAGPLNTNRISTPGTFTSSTTSTDPNGDPLPGISSVQFEARLSSTRQCSSTEITSRYSNKYYLPTSHANGQWEIKFWMADYNHLAKDIILSGTYHAGYSGSPPAGPRGDLRSWRLYRSVALGTPGVPFDRIGWETAESHTRAAEHTFSGGTGVAGYQYFSPFPQGGGGNYYPSAGSMSYPAAHRALANPSALDYWFSNSSSTSNSLQEKEWGAPGATYGRLSSCSDHYSGVAPTIGLQHPDGSVSPIPYLGTSDPAYPAALPDWSTSGNAGADWVPGFNLGSTGSYPAMNMINFPDQEEGIMMGLVLPTRNAYTKSSGQTTGGSNPTNYSATAGGQVADPAGFGLGAADGHCWSNWMNRDWALLNDSCEQQDMLEQPFFYTMHTSGGQGSNATDDKVRVWNAWYGGDQVVSNYSHTGKYKDSVPTWNGPIGVSTIPLKHYGMW